MTDTLPAPRMGPSFRWRVLSPILALVAAFAFAVVLVGVLDAVSVGEDTAVALAQTAASLGILLLAIVLWRALPTHERRLAVRRPRPSAVGIGVAVGIALIVIVGVIVTIATVVDPGIENDIKDLEGPDVGAQAWQVAVLVASLVALAPLGEEILFRALLFRGLARRLPLAVAALASSAIFARATRCDRRRCPGTRGTARTGTTSCSRRSASRSAAWGRSCSSRAR